MENDYEFRLLPELLQLILTNAVLLQMYSKHAVKRQGDKTIFIGLASVAFRWFKSLKTRYLKKKIRHFSKVYFQRSKLRWTIIRTNRNFLKEVIDPGKIILPLESCGFLTEDQVTFLTVLRKDKDKNHELLVMLQDSSCHKYSKFVNCLFTTKQMPAALILERGGEAVKVHINYEKAMWTREFEMAFLERLQRMQTENTLILNDLLNASVTKKFNDVCLLHAKLNKGIELWFWCKTKRSLNQLKGLSEDVLREIIQRLIPEHITLLKPQLIQMDYCLTSDFAERRLSIRHVGNRENLTMLEFSRQFGFEQHVSSLADKIYIAQEREIAVYWNKYPFESLNSIALSYDVFPIQIASCNINKCLYISFLPNGYHILKVEPMLDNRVSEWLLYETGLFIISVTSRGDVFVLGIRGSGNELRIITHAGTVKHTISMDDRFNHTQFIQEIMPDVVALNYDKLSKSANSCIAIMRLDENGTVLRDIEYKQIFLCLSSFRSGDLFIARQSGKVQHCTLESKVARDLLTTNGQIIAIHFDADQKQLYVLSNFKLAIYHLHYEDEVYN